MGDRVILRLEDIVKTFPGVKALDGVKLDVKEGEVHALCRLAGLYLRSYVHQ